VVLWWLLSSRPARKPNQRRVVFGMVFLLTGIMLLRRVEVVEAMAST
jgi:hypothetical protein